MAKRDFLVDIDLNKNQLLNSKLQNLATPPALGTGDKGFQYWNTTDGKPYYWTGTAWVSGSGTAYTHPNHTGDVTSTGDGATVISANVVDNTKLSQMAQNTIKGRITTGTGNPEDLTAANVRTILNVADGAQVNVATNLTPTLSATQTVINSSTGTSATIPAADSTNAGVMTAAMQTKLAGITASADVTNATTVTNAGAVMKSTYTAGSILVADSANTPTALTIGANTVVGKIAGNIQAIAIDNDLSTVSASDDTLASAKAIKAYVDTSVTGALVYQGGYDANTNTPLLDATPIAAKKGWTYTVTAAGTFFTVPVSIGDVLISEKDSPTLEADWTIVNKDIPDIVAASETASGIIELATAAEVTAGTDAVRAITPANLSAITKLGTIASGIWNGTIINSTYGGTGVNNAGRTLTINTNSGSVTFTNAATTLTVANTASVSGTNTGDQTTVSGNAGTATTLQTARNITLSGDISGTASFNGSADADITATLPNVASAGTYKSVTVNAKGLVTSGTNPTTLAGYGITDATKKYAVDITGTGAATSFTVTHNIGTTDVVTFIKDAATLAKVEVEEIVTNTNTLTINFNTAPLNGKVYRVTVIG